MPVQYTGIVEEHLAVRRAAGIFDISHMGEVTVSGRAAADFLNHTLTNDIRKLASGQGQYTLMCNEGGGVMDHDVEAAADCGALVDHGAAGVMVGKIDLPEDRPTVFSLDKAEGFLAMCSRSSGNDDDGPFACEG